MYLLYSLFLITWGVLLLPFFLYRAWRHRKYLPGLSQRFGRLPESLKFDGRLTVWFHACSVGETLSLQPVVNALHRRFPEARFVFSTITQTGQNIAARSFAGYGAGNTFYFPVDLARIIKRTLDWIRPAVIVIVDTEIWPNLVNQARLRNTPVLLVNGRISAASFRYYRWARPVLRGVLGNYRLLMMQSEEDARRIAGIGAPAEKIVVTGNIKFDKSLVENDGIGRIASDLESSFLTGGVQEAPLIVAGSTHQGEELLLLDAFRRVRQMPGLNRTRMVLAPRHPERFEEVAGLAARNGFSVRRRTDGPGAAGDAEVLLLDTIGELASVYRFATVVFVGGTLIPRGGHSVMEPALYSKAIVIGPSMENFRGIVDEFRARNGIRQISAGEADRDLQLDQLTEAFARLLQNVEERNALGAAAYAILERNRGAAGVTVDRIASVLEEKAHRQPAMSAGQCSSR